MCGIKITDQTLYIISETYEVISIYLWILNIKICLNDATAVKMKLKIYICNIFYEFPRLFEFFWEFLKILLHVVENNC